MESAGIRHTCMSGCSMRPMSFANESFPTVGQLQQFSLAEQWRLCEGPFECAAEMTLASPRNGTQIADPYPGTKTCFDVLAHAPYLPVM